MHPDSTTKTIPLSRGLVAIVDAADYELACRYKWHAVKPSGAYYAASSYGPKNHRSYIYLHRLLMNAPSGVLIDHIDGNGLNCTRANLRLATRSQNNSNRDKQPKNKSGYKGVSWDKVNKKWVAYIQVGNKSINLGRYATADDAARAYDAGAKKFHGEFARLNFPL